MAGKDRGRRGRREAPVERERPRPAWLGCVCHGKPERCLTLRGRPMPICARCAGFYIGLLAGIPAGLIISMFTHFTILPMTLIMMAGVAPLVVDGGTQYLGWRESTNGIRLVTGLLGGAVISAMWAEMLIYGSGL